MHIMPVADATKQYQSQHETVFSFDRILCALVLRDLLVLGLLTRQFEHTVKVRACTNATTSPPIPFEVASLFPVFGDPSSLETY